MYGNIKNSLLDASFLSFQYKCFESKISSINVLF